MVKSTSLFGNFQDQKEGVSGATFKQGTWEPGERNITGTGGSMRNERGHSPFKS